MKLCECGCGNPAPISTKTRPERGQVKGQPVRFIRGHHNRVRSEETKRRISEAGKGRVPSAETRAKIAEANQGRKHTSEARELIRQGKQGSRNPQWRGDDATSDSLHDWLRQNYPLKDVCEECGAEGLTHLSYQHHPDPYTRNRDDYRELCPTCHGRFDRKGKKLTMKDAEEIRRERANGVLLRILAERYGVAECTVSAIALNRLWVA